MGTTADKLAYLQGAKEAIREAIESLGGTVPEWASPSVNTRAGSVTSL